MVNVLSRRDFLRKGVYSSLGAIAGLAPIESYAEKAKAKSERIVYKDFQNPKKRQEFEEKYRFENLRQVLEEKFSYLSDKEIKNYEEIWNSNTLEARALFYEAFDSWKKEPTKKNLDDTIFSLLGGDEKKDDRESYKKLIDYIKKERWFPGKKLAEFDFFKFFVNFNSVLESYSMFSEALSNTLETLNEPKKLQEKYKSIFPWVKDFNLNEELKNYTPERELIFIYAFGEALTKIEKNEKRKKELEKFIFKRKFNQK